MRTDTQCMYVLCTGNGELGFSGDGSAATNAQMGWPHGIAVDTSGNIYIADIEYSRIRKVTVSTGIITTVAGTTQSEWAQSVILSNAYGFCTLVLVYSTLLTSRTM